MRKLRIVITLITLYFLEKLTLNSRKFKKITLRESIETVVIYVAPSNFNSKVDGYLVPDKLHDITTGLESKGIKSNYLLRYSIESRESLPFWQIFRNQSILQVRIQFYKFIVIMCRSYWAYFKNTKSGTDNQTRQKILPTFLNQSLEDTLREINPLFVLSIGATQDFLTVCEDLEIRVVEVMHGVFFKEEILREWGNSTKLKPSLVYTWHDHYTQILRECGVEAATLGYPRTDFGISKRKDNSRIRILTTLGYSHSDFQNPNLILNERLLAQLSYFNCSDAELIFRMHPVVMSNRKLRRSVLRLLNEKFDSPELHLPWKKSLEESFYGVDFHVTLSSAAYIEAALCGIPTIFIENIDSLQIPADFLSSNFAIQGGSLDFMTLLTLPHNLKASPVRNMRIDDFFRELEI
jgi:hypothetical protein